jgi:hypothetical protein
VQTVTKMLSLKGGDHIDSCENSLHTGEVVGAIPTAPGFETGAMPTDNGLWLEDLQRIEHFGSRRSARVERGRRCPVSPTKTTATSAAEMTMTAPENA